MMCVLMDIYVVDLVVLDVMMLGEDGLSLCCNLCVGKYWVVLVVLLIVCDDEIDCIIGLEMGVDDYVIKFFFLCELLVCINVVICCM